MGSVAAFKWCFFFASFFIEVTGGFAGVVDEELAAFAIGGAAGERRDAGSSTCA